MRRRLRPMPTADELVALYAAPHDHTQWVDHQIRVDVTEVLAARLCPPGGIVADLSCGDAEIARRLAGLRRAELILGDFAPGYQHTGPIEETIHRIDPDSVDLWICSETIEHLDDPDSVLVEIRKRARALILSTPDGETGTNNPEHVWGWDSEAVGDMLRVAGFTPIAHNLLDLRLGGYEYAYQIWCCT
jgi:hypothetical protein